MRVRDKECAEEKEKESVCEREFDLGEFEGGLNVTVVVVVFHVLAFQVSDQSQQQVTSPGQASCKREQLGQASCTYSPFRYLPTHNDRSGVMQEGTQHDTPQRQAIKHQATRQRHWSQRLLVSHTLLPPPYTVSRRARGNTIRHNTVRRHARGQASFKRDQLHTVRRHATRSYSPIW